MGEDITIILLYSLLGSYDHLVTTLTNEKDTIRVDVITATLLSHSQWRQIVEEETQDDDLYVKRVKIVGGTRVKRVLKKEV